MQRLYLLDLKVLRLPESLGELKLLEVFDLGVTGLAVLPEGMRNLSSLRTLRIDCDDLNELPCSLMGRLSSLKELTIIARRLKTLPDTFGNLSSLRFLKIKSRELKSLPDSLGCLSRLGVLELADLPIRTLPESFNKLSALKNLQFMVCKKPSLPASFGCGLKLLKELQLYYCSSLKCLPDSFYRLSAVERLSIEHCEDLVELGDSFGHLPALQHLTLHHTGLQRLPSSLWTLSALVELDLRSPFGGSASDLPGDDDLTFELPDSFYFPRSLQRLCLALKVLRLPESLGELVELEELHLKATGLEALPTSMRNLSSLRILTIHCIDLKELPCSLMGGLSSLKELTIRAPRLESLWTLLDICHL
ncbi:unnamed protein product [Calypogeia fissa]